MLKKLMIIFLLVTLCGCTHEQSSKEETHELETVSTESISTINDFIKKVSEDYPNYKLLDYQEGNDDNLPILFVGIANNNENNTSSTLFIANNNGVIGQVTLASGEKAHYRPDDGMSLNKNTILVSLDVETDTGTEIHDFKLTFSQEEKDGIYNTTYTNNETIR